MNNNAMLDKLVAAQTLVTELIGPVTNLNRIAATKLHGIEWELQIVKRIIEVETGHNEAAEHQSEIK